VNEAMWSEVVAATVECARGRVPVLAGVTHCGTRGAIDLAKRSKELGASAVVAAPPYYYPLGGSDTIGGHYRRIADESPLPAFLYNMPRFTGVSLDIDFVLKIADHENVLGLKDSSNDGIYIQSLLRHLGERDDFAILQGCEFMLAMTLSAGGSGTVSGISNVFPFWLTGLVNAHFAGDVETVSRLQGTLLKFLPFVRMGRTPIPTLKAGIEMLGIASSRMSSPFEPLSAEQTGRLRAFVQDNRAGAFGADA